MTNSNAAISLPSIPNETTETKELIPLKEMLYTGSVNGSIASINLGLSYENKVNFPQEPILKFPLPSEASVLGVKIKIGNREIVSALKSREEAEREYEEALDRGDSATLLNSERENVFTMSVGRIEPGEKVSASIEFVHPVKFQNNGARFTLPLVLAPRFIPAGQEIDPSKITAPIVDASKITYTAAVNIEIAPGYQTVVSSASHPSLVQDTELDRDGKFNLKLSDLLPDRDLTISMPSKEIEVTPRADKCAFESADGHSEFALVQCLPSIPSETKKRQMVLCLDCSGSMNGSSIDGLKKVTKIFLEDLKNNYPNDEIAIMKFNNSPTVIQSASLAGQVDVDKVINQLHAEGGTYAGVAINHALKIFPKITQEDVERSIILLSDGQTEDRIPAITDGIRVHGVGISSAINDSTLKNVSQLSGGSNYWIYPGEDYNKAAREIANRTFGPILRDISIKGISPDDLFGAQDIFYGQPAVMAFKGSKIPEQITMCGKDPSGKNVEITIDVKSTEQQYPRQIWAKEGIKAVEKTGTTEEITKLSLEHGLLSRHTSFVSVIERVGSSGRPERIEIPVTLPNGWEMDRGFGMGHGASHGGVTVLFRSSGGGGRRRAMPMTRSRSLFGHGYGHGYGYGQGYDDHSMTSPGDLRQFGSTLSGNPSSAPNSNLLTKSAALLDELQKGANQETIAKSSNALIEALDESLNKGELRQLSEVDRARLLNDIVKINKHGARIPVPVELRIRPVDPAAFEIWKEAQREIGLKV